MKQLFSFLIFVILIVACQGCQGEKKEATTTTEPKVEIKNIPIPRFDRDSAYQFVAKQVAFGPRVPNTKSHQATKDWLASQLKAHGATMIEQDFKAKAYTGETLNATNIIGQYNPSAKKRIVLAAHWDCRHITDNDPDLNKRDLHVDGADDGASGVGVLLEVARHLNNLPDYMGVDIVFFDAEDYGDNSGDNSESWALGSQYWSRNPHVAGYKAKYGILLDMVGAKNPRFPIEQVSAVYAPKIVNKVWKLALEMGHGTYFSMEKVDGITDDHLFVNRIAGIPMIDIINLPNNTEQKFVKHWHTTNDNMDNINKRTLGAVGQVVLAVVFNEAMGKF